MNFPVRRGNRRSLLYALAFALFATLFAPGESWALVASNNVPLDSPVYSYLEKLASFGFITTDIKGIRPFTKAEAARLLLEAERNRQKVGEPPEPCVTCLLYT